MTILTAEMVSGTHRYLANVRPEWEQSMASIRNGGGPWGPCGVCGRESYLVYRCSRCGAELRE